MNNGVFVLSNEGFDASRATKRNTSEGTVLEDYEALHPIFVQHRWTAKLVVRDNVLELHRTTRRILEFGAGFGMRIHFLHELVTRNFESWMYE